MLCNYVELKMNFLVNECSFRGAVFKFFYNLFRKKINGKKIVFRSTTFLNFEMLKNMTWTNEDLYFSENSSRTNFRAFFTVLKPQNRFKFGS